MVTVCKKFLLWAKNGGRIFDENPFNDLKPRKIIFFEFFLFRKFIQNGRLKSELNFTSLCRLSFPEIVLVTMRCRIVTRCRKCTANLCDVVRYKLGDAQFRSERLVFTQENLSGNNWMLNEMTVGGLVWYSNDTRLSDRWMVMAWIMNNNYFIQVVGYMIDGLK